MVGPPRIPSNILAREMVMVENNNKMNIENADVKRLRRVYEYMKSFHGIKDIALLVLKGHVLIDHELKRYLAYRLSLSDEEFENFEERIKNLPFFPFN